MEKTSDRIKCITDNLNNSDKPLSGQDWKDKKFSYEKGFSFWLCVHPIKSYVGYDLPQGVSDADIGRLHKLSKLLQKNSNLIVKHYENYEKPMDEEMIAQALNLVVRVCQRFLLRMIRKRIIKRDGNLYYMNPIYFFRGQYLSWHLYNLFQKDLDCVLPQWVIDRFNGDVNA